MKGIQPGSLCIVLPSKTPSDWDWVIVKVVEDMGIKTHPRLMGSGHRFWFVEATDKGARRVRHLDGTSGAYSDCCISEMFLMPIDPLNDAARERAAQKPVSA